jgi:hypothetical protein
MAVQCSQGDATLVQHVNGDSDFCRVQVRNQEKLDSLNCEEFHPKK